MFSPSIIAIIMLALGLVGTYGTMKVKGTWEAKASYEKGVLAGKGEASTATVASATKTAQAEREATEATALPADKAAIIALCKARASCRERGTLK